MVKIAKEVESIPAHAAMLTLPQAAFSTAMEALLAPQAVEPTQLLALLRLCAGEAGVPARCEAICRRRKRCHAHSLEGDGPACLHLWPWDAAWRFSERAEGMAFMLTQIDGRNARLRAILAPALTRPPAVGGPTDTPARLP